MNNTLFTNSLGRAYCPHVDIKCSTQEVELYKVRWYFIGSKYLDFFMNVCHCVIGYLVVCDYNSRMFVETGRLKTRNRIVYM